MLRRGGKSALGVCRQFRCVLCPTCGRALTCAKEWTLQGAGLGPRFSDVSMRQKLLESLLKTLSWGPSSEFRMSDASLGDADLEPHLEKMSENSDSSRASSWERMALCGHSVGAVVQTLF